MRQTDEERIIHGAGSFLVRPFAICSGRASTKGKHSLTFQGEDAGPDPVMRQKMPGKVLALRIWIPNLNRLLTMRT
jgi:hypothetical protein